jgi:hypothetical protein
MATKAVLTDRLTRGERQALTTTDETRDQELRIDGLKALLFFTAGTILVLALAALLR